MFLLVLFINVIFAKIKEMTIFLQFSHGRKTRGNRGTLPPTFRQGGR